MLLYMLSSFSCPTAKDVYHALREEMPNITLSTVYTALHFFVKMGIVKAHPGVHTPVRYECLIPVDPVDLQDVV